MKRKMMESLIQWKESHDKPLILYGARQVGKTYLIRQFATENYSSWLEMNFILDSRWKTLFQGTLNVDEILRNLSLYSDFRYRPEQGRQLLFLDEIQECPEARTALKAFREDGRFDVIASGSLLGVKYRKVPSFPTGSVTHMTLYPMDFEEFLWANGIDMQVMEYIRECFLNRQKVIEAVNARMHELFRQYMVIGGMPAVVEAYAELHDMGKVLTIQRDLLADYRNDMLKYAHGVEKAKTVACYDSIPAQLGKENKKFQFSKVEKGAARQKYQGSTQWLIDANAVLPCYRLKDIRVPLKAYEEMDDYKLYLSDTGMLVAMLEDGMAAQILLGELDIWKGAVYENIVAQSLTAKGKRLYYYNRNNSLEIDFVVPNEAHPYLLEVKAGNNHAKALRTLVREGNHADCLAYKLIGGNVGDTSPDGIVTIPVYMVIFL